MGLLDVLKNKISPEPRTLKTEEYIVAGTNYYEGNIKKLATSNNEYKSKAKTIIENGNAEKKIFQYDFINKPVKLIPEPKNKHDKNAVQVVIAGELVGYISKEENVHVKNILSKHEIKYISAFISGGKYKIVSLNEDILKGEYNIKIQIKIGYV